MNGLWLFASLAAYGAVGIFVLGFMDATRHYGFIDRINAKLHLSLIALWPLVVICLEISRLSRR